VVTQEDVSPLAAREFRVGLRQVLGQRLDVRAEEFDPAATANFA
jgi:hypothetical protein